MEILISDSFCCDGEMLLVSLAVQAARKRLFPEVHFVLFDTNKVLFCKRYQQLENSGVIVNEAESLQDFLNTSCYHPKTLTPSAFFIDTVTGFLRDGAFDKTLSMLKRLTSRFTDYLRQF